MNPESEGALAWLRDNSGRFREHYRPDEFYDLKADTVTADAIERNPI